MPTSFFLNCNQVLVIEGNVTSSFFSIYSHCKVEGAICHKEGASFQEGEGGGGGDSSSHEELLRKCLTHFVVGGEEGAEEEEENGNEDDKNKKRQH